MKILFTGGQKSGKSRLAEQRTLQLTSTKPFYCATAEVTDSEFSDRIKRHQADRGDTFRTIEEPCSLTDVLSDCDDAILVDCLTVWINNMMYHEREDDIIPELDRLLALPQTIVFVINEVGSGIIPLDALSRRFADLSGIVAQRVAAAADEVHFCSAGLSLRMK